MCNAMGATAGAVFALVYGEALARAAARPRLALSAPLLLLAFWAAYLVYRPMPVSAGHGWRVIEALLRLAVVLTFD